MENPREKNQKDSYNTWKELGRGFGDIMNIGYYIAASILIGLFLGYNLDRFLGTQPLFTLVLVFLGAAAGLREIFKAASRK